MNLNRLYEIKKTLSNELDTLSKLMDALQRRLALATSEQELLRISESLDSVAEDICTAHARAGKVQACIDKLIRIPMAA